MTFFKYRHNSRSSLGNWEYAETNYGDWPPEKQIEDMKDTLIRDCDWSDLEGYRGCEVEIVERPPEEWLQARIKTGNQTIEVWQERIKRYLSMLSNASRGQGPEDEAR
jgi:hypothetical protein